MRPAIELELASASHFARDTDGMGRHARAARDEEAGSP